MRTILFTAFITLGLFLCSCLSESEPDLRCTSTDLELVLESKIDPTCKIPGSIKVTATGAVGALTYKINGSGSQSTGDFDGVSSGAYEISVQDAQNCTAVLSVSLPLPPDGVIASIVQTTNAGCGSSSGSFEVSGSGGRGDLTYRIKDQAEQATGLFQDLPRGKYEVIVEDSVGCMTAVEAKVTSGVTIAGDIAPIINSNCAVSGCHNGSQSPNLSTEAGILANAKRIELNTTAGAMPPDDEPDLTTQQIATIACWAADVALD